MNTQTEQKHAATPWHVRVDTVHGFKTKIETLNGLRIASSDLTTDRNPTKEIYLIREANAAFIVKACNEHDDLVEALKLIAGNAGAALLGNELAKTEKLRHIRNIALDALAKAS